MQLADALRLLETHMQAWTATPVAYENVDPRNLTQVGQPLLPAGTTDYVAMRTTLDHSQPITVPNRCHRYHGTVYFAVCVQAGTGSRTLAGYVDSLIALFEAKQIAGTAGVLRTGRVTFSQKYQPSDGWYVHEIGFNFAYERYTVS